MMDAGYNYCALPLAGYATRPDHSRGRLHHEPESRTRTPFQRDRDRIIHASAFRRLKDKTQVFVAHEGDHYRTRLSHTLEVAQITRSLARALYANEDLAEAVALAHDLGHTPFAHMGEDVLRSLMMEYGGFDHNDQSLRVLTVLEEKYPRWSGLNLTWETLEGVIKHNGPLALGQPKDGRNPPYTLLDLAERVDFALDTHASIEAQIAAISDDIAYNNHDVEDGVRAGFFTLDDLGDLTLLGPVIGAVREDYPECPEGILIAELIRRMIGVMVDDVLEQTQLLIGAKAIDHPDHVREAGETLVRFSPDIMDAVNELRDFLFERMYRHYTINAISHKVDRMLRDLFAMYHNHPHVLPPHWQEKITAAGGRANDTVRARIVCDYIAGMTDRFAVREHDRLFVMTTDRSR